MARIRTVKPEFWTDDRITECSFITRLFFIGTWNFADDHGGLERSAKQLKAQIFPHDNIDCEPLIQELLQTGMLVEYQSGGKKYLHIKGFNKHQKTEKKAAPRVPLFDDASAVAPTAPADSGGVTDSNSGSTESSRGSSDSRRGTTETSSGSSLGMESKGREGNVISERARDRGPDPNTDSAELSQLERLKRAYPKGIYAQSDWLIAEREARRRIHEGHTWGELIAGCERYASQCDAKGNVGTQYVESPKKFFVLPECKFRDAFPHPAAVRNGSARKPFTPAPTTAELEAQEAARGTQ